MSKEKGFAIVSFVNEKHDLAIVPLAWIVHDNKVLWPPEKVKGRLNRLVKDEVLPELDWNLFEVRVIFKRGKGEYFYLKSSNLNQKCV